MIFLFLLSLKKQTLFSLNFSKILNGEFSTLLRILQPTVLQHFLVLAIVGRYQLLILAIHEQFTLATLAASSQMSLRSMALSFSTFMACIFFLMASMAMASSPHTAFQLN